VPGSEKMREKKSEELVERLAENQKRILMLIAGNLLVSKKVMAESLVISTTAIDKNLAKPKQKGILRRVGPAKGGHWEVMRQDER
jgi:ATP-dependent DNA helicase RecG